MDTCIGNKYVELIDRTECIGNSLLKINTNFAELDKQICNLDSTVNSFINNEGILKIENGAPVLAVAGVDYFLPGAAMDKDLKVTGNMSSTGDLSIGGNAILSQNVTIGQTLIDSTLTLRGQLTFETPSLKKNIQLIGNQINAGPLVNAEDTLLLNYTGYNGGTTHFRNLNICNGKQTSVVYVDSTLSRVGVKTTSPQSAFHVAGDLRVDGNIICNAPLSPNMVVSLNNISSSTATEGQILTYTNGAVRWSPLTIPNNLFPQEVTGTGVKIFDTPGAWTWTVPANVTRVTIEMYGAGGGGSSTEYLNRPGFQDTRAGGGGGHAVYTIEVIPGTTYNLYVGAGGAGGTLPSSWIGLRSNTPFQQNSNYKGGDGGDTWCTIGGITITAGGGKGGGTRKTFRLNTGQSLEMYAGGDGGSVPIISPYVGQGTGGVFKHYSSSLGTGSGGGYGGESGGLRKGGGTGIFSCGGVGGSRGSSKEDAVKEYSLADYSIGVSDAVNLFKFQFAQANYDETLDNQWRDGLKYGGGGAAARIAVATTPVTINDRYGPNWNQQTITTAIGFNTEISFAPGYLGSFKAGSYTASDIVSPAYYKGGKGANGAIIVRF